MAQPLQYQSQFIPTDFSTVSHLTNLYAKDMDQRDQLFDQAAQFESSALGALGSLPTEDVAGRQERLDALNKSIDEALKKRGGDYGAAAKDLYRIVAKEKANPWYQFNTQQLQAKDTARKLGQDANNIVIANVPKTFNEAQQLQSQGVDPYAVSALNKKDVYATAKDIADNYKNLLLTNPQYRLSTALNGQYWEKVAQHGFDDQSINTFIESGEGSKIMESMLASYPELGTASENQVKEIIKQGLRSAIGPTDSRELANQNYISDLDKIKAARLGAGEGSPLRKAGELSLPFSRDIAAASNTFDRQAVEMVKGTELEGKIKSYKDLVDMSGEMVTQPDPFPGPGKTNIIQGLSPRAVEAERLLNNFESTQSKGMSIPSWNLDPLSTNDATEAGHIQKLQDAFDKRLKTKVKGGKFIPINKQDKKALDKFDWTKDFSFEEVAYDSNSGLKYTDPYDGSEKETSGYGTGFVIKLVGSNKDKEYSEIMVRLPRSKDNMDLEFSIASWLRSFDPSFNDVYMKDAAITWNK